MSEDDSVSWWNSLCGSSYHLVVEGGVIKRPPVETIIYVFTKISPFLTITLSNYSNFNEPWNMLHSIMKVLFEDAAELPNPNQDFRNFLVFLYSKRNELNINTPKKISTVIDCFQNVKKPYFLLWSVPETLDNPLLYVETLHEMLVTQSLFMKKLLIGLGNVDIFFDRFLPMINETNPQLSCGIVEVLTLFLKEKMQSIYHISETITTFYDKLLSGMRNTTSIEYSVSCFRSATYLIVATKNYFPTNHMNEMLTKLINSTFDVPHLHSLAIRYVIDLKSPKFPYISLAKKLLSKENVSLENLEFIEEMLKLPNFEKKFAISQLLFNLSVQDKFWSRAATSIVQRTIGSIIDKQETIGWLSSVAKRTLLFVGAAAVRKKYQNRRMCIMAMHESLFKLKLDWYNKPVQKMYSSLVNTKKMPKMGVNISVEKFNDYKFLSEVEAAASKKNIKLILVLTEPIENAPNTALQRSTTSFLCKSPRPAITKPTSKKSNPKVSGVTKVTRTAKMTSTAGTTKITTTIRKKNSPPNVIVRVNTSKR